MSQDDRPTELGAKLDTLIRLQALQLIANVQTVRDKAVLLSKAGLSSREIAGLCETTTNTISVALSNAKKTKSIEGKD